MKKRPYKKLFKTYILHGDKAILAERQQMEEGLRYTSLLIQINQVLVYNLFFLIWVIYCFSELSHIKNCIIRYFTIQYRVMKRCYSFILVLIVWNVFFKSSNFCRILWVFHTTWSKTINNFNVVQDWKVCEHKTSTKQG